MQRDYIKTNFYDKAAASLKSAKGFDINDRSFALKEVLFSTAVQHGHEAVSSIFGNTNLNGSDAQIIEGVYNERTRKAPNLKTVRFDKEKQDAFKMLNEHSPILH